MPSAPTNTAALQHYVELWEDRGHVRGQHSQPEPRWVRVAYLWASIEPISGREFFQAQQIVASVTHRIRCRYRPGVRTTQQIRWQGRVYQIGAVLNILERNEWLEIMATEHLDGDSQ